MIRVFIYHSSSERLQYLQKITSTYFQKKRHTYHLTCCCKYSDAASYLSGPGKKDDIFFFDFSDFSQAFRLTCSLREQNFRAVWVYTDGTPENLYRTLLIQPSAYIENSGIEKTVLAVLDQLEQYHQFVQKKHYFCFKFEGEYLRIPFEEISFFESNAKKVTLYQAKSDKRYYFAAKLDDISSQVSSDFLRCHQSYLVNMHMIRRLDTQNHVFRLYSNEEILISRRNYKEAKERYEQFLAELGG